MFFQKLQGVPKNSKNFWNKKYMVVFSKNLIKWNFCVFMRLFSLQMENFSVAKATLQSQMSVCLSVCPSISKTPQQQEIIIIHHSYSIFIILHSSFLHFVTFKLLSLFTKQCPFTWNFAIQPKKFHKTKSSTLKDTPPKVTNSELGLNHF